LSNLTSITRDSARGSFFLVAGNILSAVIQAIGVFLLARLLGPDLYGAYTLSLVVPMLFMQLVDLGVSQGLIKFSASLKVKGEKAKIATFIRNGLLFKLFISLAFLCFAILFSDFLATYAVNRPSIAFYMRLASLSIVFYAVSDTAVSAFIGLDRAEYSALTINVQALVKSTLSILLVALGLSLSGAITGVVAGALASAFTGLIILLKFYKTLNDPKENGIGFKEIIKTIVGYSFPIYLSALLIQSVSQLQGVILSMYVSDADIGNFRASSNFITLLSLLIGPIATALFPAFSKLESDNNELKRFFAITIKYVTLIVVPASTAIIIFSEQLNLIIYGPKYVSAPTYLMLQAPIFLLAGLGYQVLNSLFNGANETKTTLKMCSITFLIFILLSPPLTMQLSVPGLIIALLASNLAATLYGAYKAKTMFKVEYPYKTLLLIYAASALSALSAYITLQITPFPTVPNFATAASVYLITYITLLPLMKAITKQEIEEITIATERIPLIKPIIKLLLKYEAKIVPK
jgi:O-antigen/teichoic acid export membrane protein